MDWEWDPPDFWITDTHSLDNLIDRIYGACIAIVPPRYSVTEDDPHPAWAGAKHGLLHPADAQQAETHEALLRDISVAWTSDVVPEPVAGEARRSLATSEFQALNRPRRSVNLNRMITHLWDDRARFASFILEYCDKGSLSGMIDDMVKRQRRFSDSFAWHAMIGIAKGLAFLHGGIKDAAHGRPNPGWNAIFHLDLKPNIPGVKHVNKLVDVANFELKQKRTALSAWRVILASKSENFIDPHLDSLLMLTHAARRLLPDVGGQRFSFPHRLRAFSWTRLASSATREDYPRIYRVLSLETSCDDTSVAVVTARKFHRPDDLHASEPKWKLETHYHERLTANNNAYGGIHPLVALESHRANTAPLVKQALKALDEAKGAKRSEGPGALDFVAVTRGPGMRSNLSVGLDTAKGIAAALNIPLIGVHHMQAHALTPRLMTAISNADANQRRRIEAGATGETIATLEPAFPFLTLLVSGGHTMLLDSKCLTEHRVLAETQEIAIGQYLDKAARAILPPELLKAPYGRSFEEFAFQSISKDSSERGKPAHGTTEDYVEPCRPRYKYSPPRTKQELLERRDSLWGWALTPPLVERAGGESKRMEYTFAGLLTFIERLVDQRATEPGCMTSEERRALAQEVQRVAFEHLASRVLLYLTSRAAADWKGDTIVVSGGVAANNFLRHVLRSILDARGFGHIKLAFPPIELSTDNALMIAWAGIEMYDAGWRSSLDIGPIRKWSLDPTAPDGGILGVKGWIKESCGRDEEE
ncbi:hypothetical protein B0A55_10751 [Friedmanniomyces simplex]|uniref:N(6)-L-threonylcarbamoyladenine synthase n=1 Tax=Friedmanniomyces simplex TaxID=329884 RepID=A0A4U0WRK5_9PEZI|nr:hypothetical protein B0A55_10751 [Friedmanniomyces simplex]